MTDSLHTPAHLSPAQAAQAADVSRWTIMRAIKSHELKATRDNRNHWKITPDDLEAWTGAQCAHTVRAHPDMPTLHTPETALELAALKAENSQLRERLTSTETDRDHWRSMAEKLADQPKRRWWIW